MHRGYRYLSFLFLTAAFTAPTASRAGVPQEVVILHDDGGHTRYYDRDHRDYHEWNNREDRSYRLYLGQRHGEYREFHVIGRRRQRNYWNWRHSHPDRN
jgi:hypothetical protein